MKTIKYLNFLLALLFLVQGELFGQSGDWVWLKGDNLGNSPGNYGSIGVSSPTNEIPGRYQAAYWLDLQGNFWVFGGASIVTPSFNDLWKYDPSTNEWTWMNGPQNGLNLAGNYGTLGIPSTLNYPPALGYGSNCWTSPDGDLWLFAGFNANGFSTSDVLFRYHIATNEWTWMGGTQAMAAAAVYGPKGVAGAAYFPGGRQECKSGWVFQNKLWTFGGQDVTSAHKNDIWSYDLATNLWAWEGGGQANNVNGVYGVKGVSSPLNEPPARCSYTKWQDNDNFYIFAGADFFGLSNFGRNDVWKFDKITKEWTWISGSNAFDDMGTNNPYCDPDPNDIPLSRLENQTAQTASTCVKAFWTFGGFDFSGTNNHNDLWLFNTANLEWTKVKGQANAGGVQPPFSYGVKGTPAPSNLIPGRGGTCVWSDANGNLYVFGGGGGPSGSWEYMNDLWKFIPDTSCVKTGLVGSATLVPPANTVICPGDTITMPVPANVAINITPNTGYTYDPVTNIVYFHCSTSTTYTVMANSIIPNDPCFTGDTIIIPFTTIPPPIVDFTLTPQYTTIDNPNFNMVNHSLNAQSYQWLDSSRVLLSTAQDLTRTENAVGVYCYTLIGTNQCGDFASKTDCAYVLDRGGLAVPNVFSPNGDSKNDLFKPIPLEGIAISSYYFTIFDRWGKELFRTKNLSDGWNGKYKGEDCENGVYFYHIETFTPSNQKLVYKGDVTIVR